VDPQENKDGRAKWSGRPQPTFSACTGSVSWLFNLVGKTIDEPPSGHVVLWGELADMRFQLITHSSGCRLRIGVGQLVRLTATDLACDNVD
jgi:hypothetical protein